MGAGAGRRELAASTVNPLIPGRLGVAETDTTRSLTVVSYARGAASGIGGGGGRGGAGSAGRPAAARGGAPARPPATVRRRGRAAAPARAGRRAAAGGGTEAPRPGQAAAVQQRRVGEAETAHHGKQRGLQQQGAAVAGGQQLTGLGDLAAGAVKPGDHENRDADQDEGGE